VIFLDELPRNPTGKILQAGATRLRRVAPARGPCYACGVGARACAEGRAHACSCEPSRASRACRCPEVDTAFLPPARCTRLERPVGGMVRPSRNWLATLSPPRSLGVRYPQYTQSRVCWRPAADVDHRSLRFQALFGSSVGPHMSVRLVASRVTHRMLIRNGHDPRRGSGSRTATRIDETGRGGRSRRSLMPQPAIDSPTAAMPVGFDVLVGLQIRGRSWLRNVSHLYVWSSLPYRQAGEYQSL